MNNVSKTGLKITRVEIKVFSINKEAALSVFNGEGNGWLFQCGIQRNVHTRLDGKQYDVLILDTEINYSSREGILLAQILTLTHFSTKHLLHPDVDAEFREYINRIALDHSIAAMAYKSTGTPMEGHIMSAVDHDQFTKDAKSKIREIWI